MYDVWFHWLDSMKTIIATTNLVKTRFTEYRTPTNIVDIFYQHSSSTLTSHITKRITIFLNTLYTLPSTKQVFKYMYVNTRKVFSMSVDTTNEQTADHRELGG